MQKFIAAATIVALATSATAQISFTGPAYFEAFNGLPTAPVTPSPFSATIGQQFVLTGQGLTGWSAAKIAGTGTAAMPFGADAGTSASGAIISYGDVGSGERALGSLASGSNVPGFGLEIVNNAAYTITDVTLKFDREVWRSSTSLQNILSFAWGVSGGTITSANFLTEASMTADASGNLVGLAPVGTNGPVNPPDVLAVVVNLSGLSVAPGQSLFFRWTDANDTGNDAGIAIDNFEFSAIPAPASLALLGLGGLVALRRKR